MEVQITNPIPVTAYGGIPTYHVEDTLLLNINKAIKEDSVKELLQVGLRIKRVDSDVIHVIEKHAQKRCIIHGDGFHIIGATRYRDTTWARSHCVRCLIPLFRSGEIHRVKG